MKAPYLAPLLSCITLSFLANATRAEVIPDGSMGSSDVINAVNGEYEIPATIGTTAGNNLFHSFNTFNIETGYSADFSGPSNITNVVARVTGDSFSSIDGALGCSISGANLYLINPNGILFGEGASLNVSGSFYASTADYLGFESGEQLHADISQPVNLAVSDPSSFGFLQEDPASIIVNGSHLNVGNDQHLGLIGGDLTIIGNNTAPAQDTGIVPADTSIPANLSALSGEIELVSVNSSGEAVMSNDGIDTSSFNAMGTIIMANQAMLTASGDAAGSVVVRGGELVMVQSYMYANAYGADDGTPSSGIEIDLTGDMTMEYLSVIGTDVVGEASDAGGITINADDILITNGSDIQSSVWSGSSNGSSGDIQVNSNTLTLSNYGILQTYSGGLGNGGGINITTSQLNVQDGAQIVSYGNSLYGTTGDVIINADDIFLSGANVDNANTLIGSVSVTQATNDVADILINTNSLTIDRAFIVSSTLSATGGDIIVNADNINISGTSSLIAGIQSNNFGTGTGGSINLNSTDQASVTEHALVQSATYSAGASGEITIDTDYLEVSNAGKIVSGGSGGAGGDSGNITINAEHIALSGLEHTDNHQTTDATGIINVGDANGGMTGNITIQATTLDMENRSFISSSSYGSGDAGDIDIATHTVNINSGSLISSSALDSGNGGDINIHADSLNISGLHPDITTNQFTNLQQPAVSAISSQTLGNGDAGNVNLFVNNIAITDGGRISSETFANGSGGDINIESRELVISGFATLLENTQLVANSGIYSSASSVDFYSATGDGGNINVHTGSASISDSAILSSDTTGPGDAGNISINATDFDLQGGASVTTISTNTGDAGTIDISAEHNLTVSNAVISAQASQSNGGNIKLAAGNMLSLKDSEVSTAVLAQSGNGGNITMDADLVALNHATITASAVDGRGGNITINAGKLIKSGNTIIDASSEKSISGNVQLSPDSGISSALTKLSEDDNNIAASFASDCAAQQMLPNSLIVSHNRRDSYPDDLLHSTRTSLKEVQTIGRTHKPQFILASIIESDCRQP